MENDDEFGFKSLAQSFAPEVKAERKAEALVPQPVSKAPVARVVPPPAIPEVSPQEVAAAIPQQPAPQAPAIQNPVFDPEFQKAAGVTALAPAIAGLGVAGGAAYGYYKGRKSVQDRMMGQTKAPEGLDTSRLDPEWQKILAQSERNRQAKQAEAVKNIQPVVQPEPTNVAPNAPKSIQGTLQPENSVKSVPSINNAQLQFGNENKIANMMANQEMRNPLGGLASAYTEPLRGAQIPSDIPTIADLTNQVTGKAGVEPPTTTTELAKEAVAPTEGKKKGRTPGAKNKTPEQRALEESTKGMNMYRNMFGYDAKNPESPKSLAAVEATNRLINEGFGGQLPASRDPFLNPATDLTKEGKKFYSGTPEGYRNTYIPWLQENLHTLPPETQSHVLHSMTKGQTADLGKIMKGLGIAGTALGASGLAFSATPQAQAAMQRAGAAIKDIGISPDLLQGKGEELGRLGSAYVTGGNPQYRQQLLGQMQNERDPQRYQMLLSEFKKAGGNIPGGRGAISPPQ